MKLVEATWCTSFPRGEKTKAPKRLEERISTLCWWQCVCASVLQSCLTLRDPMDCSLLGSSIHGILQARILEWVAVPSSRGIFPTKGLNPGLLHCRQILYHLSCQGSPWWQSGAANPDMTDPRPGAASRIQFCRTPLSPYASGTNLKTITLTLFQIDQCMKKKQAFPKTTSGLCKGRDLNTQAHCTVTNMRKCPQQFYQDSIKEMNGAGDISL